MCVLCFYTQAPHLQIGSWNTLQRFLSQSEAPMLQWNKGIGWKPENLDQDRPDPKTLKTPESCKTEQKTEQKTLQHISKSEFAEFTMSCFIHVSLSIWIGFVKLVESWQRKSDFSKECQHLLETSPTTKCQFAPFKLLLKDVRILQS